MASCPQVVATVVAFVAVAFVAVVCGATVGCTCGWGMSVVLRPALSEKTSIVSAQDHRRRCLAS